MSEYTATHREFLEEFKSHLEKEGKSRSTVRNYSGDLRGLLSSTEINGASQERMSAKVFLDILLKRHKSSNDEISAS